MFTEIRDGGAVVLDEASAGQIEWAAARTARLARGTPLMEFDDLYQEGLLLHMRRMASPPPSHRCTPECRHSDDYRPPVECHHKLQKRFRDMRLRAGSGSRAKRMSMNIGILQQAGLLEVPDHAVDVHAERRKILATALLACLDTEERAVVLWVFEGPGEFAAQVARESGWSKRRVRRVLERALAKMRVAAVKMLAVDAAMTGAIG